MQPGLPYTTYPSFATSSSHGHFPYSTAGAYAYAYPAPGTVPYGTPYVPSGAGPVGTLPYGASQPTYHPHLYSYQSFGSHANYYVGMYSALNSSGAAGKKQTKKKASTSAPKAIEETIAASVASLPPRSEFARQDNDESREISSTKELEEPSGSIGTTPQPKEEPAVSATSPDVLQAVEELTALSNLDPEQLTQVLNARPQLREAVKILLAHQAQLPGFPSDSTTASSS